MNLFDTRVFDPVFDFLLGSTAAPCALCLLIGLVFGHFHGKTAKW